MKMGEAGERGCGKKKKNKKRKEKRVNEGVCASDGASSSPDPFL